MRKHFSLRMLLLFRWLWAGSLRLDRARPRSAGRLFRWKDSPLSFLWLLPFSRNELLQYKIHLFISREQVRGYRSSLGTWRWGTPPALLCSQWLLLRLFKSRKEGIGWALSPHIIICRPEIHTFWFFQRTGGSLKGSVWDICLFPLFLTKPG